VAPSKSGPVRRLVAVLGVCIAAMVPASCAGTPAGRIQSKVHAAAPAPSAEGWADDGGDGTVGSDAAGVSAPHGPDAADVSLAGVVAVPQAGLCGATAASAPPSAQALRAIPAPQMQRYRAAAVRFGVPWQLLAGIGAAETAHGTSADQVSSTGALGTMQFMPETWSSDGSVRVAVTPLGESPTGYATDGDGDGFAEVWNPADAVAASARMLARNGAAAGTPEGIRAAVYAYNHDWAYVDTVTSRARSYGAAAPAWAAGTCGLLVLDA